MHQLLQAYQAYIKEHALFPSHARLLLAASGGLDSSVMVHLTIASGFSVVLAHMNFQLRGEESMRDELFVKQLAADYGVPVFVQRVDTHDYARHHQRSTQEAARELRYAWFRNLVQEQGLDFILTAHHADDNVETVLMNLFKGTGMAGLKGILPKQDILVRPLLFTNRDTLADYAREHGISFVTDSSNLTDKYTRNFFRQHVIPLVEQVYPGTRQSLRLTIPRMAEAAQLYREAVDRHLKKLVTHRQQDIWIPVEKLRKSNPLDTIVFELFYPYGFSSKQVPELIRFLDASTGSIISSSTHRLLKNRQWLILTALVEQTFSWTTISETDERARFPDGQIIIRKNLPPAQPSPDPMETYMDAAQLRFPLILRKWKAGDYFYPLGMNKKKKLARFFIDQKLSLAEKENSWVLESDGRIAWVLGRRLDNRFRITPATREMVRLRWQITPPE